MAVKWIIIAMNGVVPQNTPQKHDVRPVPGSVTQFSASTDGLSDCWSQANLD